MKRRRYSLPSERPDLHNDDSKLRRDGYPLLVILAIPSVLGCIWRAFFLGEWGTALLGLIASAPVTWVFWNDLVLYRLTANVRTYHRYEQPVRYWLNMIFLALFYIMWVFFLFFSEHARTEGAMHR